MFTKTFKSGTINLILLASIASTTFAPTAQAGIFDYLKKFMPSFLVGSSSNQNIIDDPRPITLEQTEMSTQEATEGNSIISDSLGTKIFAFGALALFSLSLIVAYNKTKIKRSEELDRAPEEKIREIKQVAKELKLSDEEIQKIKVSVCDSEYRNNAAASSFCPFENLVILGLPTGLQKHAENKFPGTKKFTYAHELSHIKYGHTKPVKAILIESIPFLISFPATILLGKIVSTIVETILPKTISKKIKFSAKRLILCSAEIILKLIMYSIMASKIEEKVLPIITSSILKSREMEADLGAASLGNDVIIGGILGFEISLLMKKDVWQRELDLIISLKNEFEASFRSIDDYIIAKRGMSNHLIIPANNYLAVRKNIEKIEKLSEKLCDKRISDFFKSQCKEIESISYDILVDPEKQNQNEVEMSEYEIKKNNFIKSINEIISKISRQIEEIINTNDIAIPNSTHPTDRTRINYLEKLLQEDQKIRVKHLMAQLVSEYGLEKVTREEIEEIEDSIIENVKKIDCLEEIITKINENDGIVTLANCRDAYTKFNLIRVKEEIPYRIQEKLNKALDMLNSCIMALHLIARTENRKVKNDDKFANNEIRRASMETVDFVAGIISSVLHTDRDEKMFRVLKEYYDKNWNKVNKETIEQGIIDIDNLKVSKEVEKQRCDLRRFLVSIKDSINNSATQVVQEEDTEEDTEEDDDGIDHSMLDNDMD